MRSLTRIWLCGSLALFLVVWSSAAFAKDKDKDKGDKAPGNKDKGAISKGIGKIVSGWSKSGLHGKELAARIHELIAARKADKDQVKGKGQDKGKPDHAGKGKGKDKEKGKPDHAGKGKGKDKEKGKPDHAGKGKGKDKEKGKPDFAGKGGKGKDKAKGGKPDFAGKGGRGKKGR